MKSELLASQTSEAVLTIKSENNRTNQSSEWLSLAAQAREALHHISTAMA